MGVWPCGAQVWITLGINWKPDSSAKTMRAPNRAAFFYRWPVFLFPACNRFFIPLQGPPFWLLRTPFRTVHQTADMVEVMLNSILTLDQFEQCERWSTDWFDSRAPEVLAKANDQAFRRTWLSFKGRPEEYRTRKAFSPPLRPHPQALRRSPTRPGIALASYPTTACDEPRCERGAGI